MKSRKLKLEQVLLVSLQIQVLTVVSKIVKIIVQLFWNCFSFSLLYSDCFLDQDISEARSIAFVRWHIIILIQCTGFLCSIIISKHFVEYTLRLCKYHILHQTFHLYQYRFTDLYDCNLLFIIIVLKLFTVQLIGNPAKLILRPSVTSPIIFTIQTPKYIDSLLLPYKLPQNLILKPHKFISSQSEHWVDLSSFSASFLIRLKSRC